jgi:2-iminobutanoate/2-iminopropanoate deaminase
MKKIINTNNSPAPIGPYNQAVLKNNMLFISGQIALVPNSMVLNNDSIKDETHQVMKNLKNILVEAGMDFKNVVKTSIFLSDMKFEWSLLEKQ